MTDLLAKMILKAKETIQNSYAPYSNYNVCCCVCSEDDTLYAGVNVENGSYGLTLCAESSAISQLISAGQKSIKHVVIINGEGTQCPPCGACRQRIFEFSSKNTQIHLCDHEKVQTTFSIQELLPMAYTLTPNNGNNDD